MQKVNGACHKCQRTQLSASAQVPFEAAKPLDVAMQHLTDTPPSPRELRPEISPELEAVILKALAKEPIERYRTGAALADALDQALQTRSEALPPTTLSRLSIPERVAVELAGHPLSPLPATVTPGIRQAELPATMEPATSPPSTAPVGRRPAPYLIAAGVILAAVTICLLAGLFLYLRQSGPEEGAAASVSSSTPTTELVGTLSPTVTPPSASLATPTATPTAPVMPTAIPTTPVAPVAPPTEPPVYNLLIVKRGEDSPFVVNQSSQAFPWPR